MLASVCHRKTCNYASYMQRSMRNQQLELKIMTLEKRILNTLLFWIKNNNSINPPYNCVSCRYVSLPVHQHCCGEWGGGDYRLKINQPRMTATRNSWNLSSTTNFIAPIPHQRLFMAFQKSIRRTSHSDQL